MVTDRKLAIDDGIYDHVTSSYTSATPDGVVDYYVGDVVSQSDYYPFGMLMPNRNESEADYRYGFNGMEKDDEVSGEADSYDFGARLYNPRVGRWLSTDPYDQFIASPYFGFANNPILLVDIDGGWIPVVQKGTGDIVLMKEVGDNKKSLISFFGGVENARKYLSQEQLDVDPPIFVKLTSDNVYSESTRDAAANPENYEAATSRADLEDKQNYNCHTAALCGSGGIEFSGEGILDVDERNQAIGYLYDEVDPTKAILGETIITFGDYHTAVYFGTSRDGTIYQFSKPGQTTGPTITKLNEITGGVYGYVANPSTEPNGTIVSDRYVKDPQPDNTGHDPQKEEGTGFFNPKKGAIPKIKAFFKRLKTSTR